MSTKLSPAASAYVHPCVYGFRAGTGGHFIFRARAEALAESWEFRYLAASPDDGDDVGWRARASCSRVSIERWWDLGHRQSGKAISICSTCPVRSHCVRSTRHADDRANLRHIESVSAGFTGPARVRMQRRLRGEVAA